MTSKWRTAANIVFGAFYVVLWAGIWLYTFPAYRSDKVIKNGIEPWIGTVVLLPVMAILLYSFLRFSNVRQPLRWSAATMVAILALAVGQYVLTGPAKADMAVGRAFTVAEFVRERNGKVQTLAFIGQQHLADLAYYVVLDREIGRLTKEGATFYYEDTDAFGGLPGVDTLTYGMPVARFYIDLVHQADPGHWPSSDPGRWERRDLGKDSPEVIEARKGDGEGAKCRIQLERDRHLLKAIDAFVGERLAVFYGLDHLANVYGRLLEQGWRETFVRLLPEGRKPLDLDGYCDTDVDLRRLERFAARIGATVNPPAIR
jgi:hypothetical protein